MNNYFNADEILGAQDLPFEDVEIPEWGGKMVRMIGLDAEATSKISAEMVKIGNDGQVQAVNMDGFLPRMVALSAHRMDENGQFVRIFTEAQVAALGHKSGRVLKRLADIAGKLSGLAEETNQALAKN